VSHFVLLYTIQKFISLTLPTRTHVHQLLNTQQSVAIEDLNQLVLHAVVLALDRCMPVRKHNMGMHRAGARTIP
jgi:hypothetical protein